MFDKPPKRQRSLALSPNLNGNLVRRAADSPRLNFHSWLGVVYTTTKHDEGIFRVRS